MEALTLFTLCFLAPFTVGVASGFALKRLIKRLERGGYP